MQGDFHNLVQELRLGDRELYFRIGRSTVSKIIRETCDAIWAVLHEEYLKPANSNKTGRESTVEFQRQWNFPHPVGAIDGKHVAIQCPWNSGSLFYKYYYKGFFSIALLAVCDAHYCFTLLNIWNYGSNNNSGVSSHSTMGQALEADQPNLPNSEPLDWRDHPFQYFLIGDEAFALKQRMHCKSKRSVLAPKIGRFLWVKYSTIFGANSARLEWSCFGPNKQGWSSPVWGSQNEYSGTPL